MSIVISDTSPIRALQRVEQLNLLQQLFGQVLVPPAVRDELASSPRHPDVIDVTKYPFITVRAPSDHAAVAALRHTLDAGEAEAIALAQEFHAEAILMDESRGRTAAQQRGLRPVGVLAILAEAKQKRLIVEARPILDRLRNEFRFFVSEELYAAFLNAVGETR